MASEVVVFRNAYNGQVRKVPIGFSWTTFFFGFFPALFRGDWKWAILQLLLSLVTVGLSGLYFMFAYNKIYLRELIDNGFELVGNREKAEELYYKVGLPIKWAGQ